MLKVDGMLGRFRSDIGKARGVSFEDMLVAALVAAPFTATFAIWISQMTWWPNLLIMLIWLLAQLVGTVWVAGYRREDAADAAVVADGEGV